MRLFYQQFTLVTNLFSYLFARSGLSFDKLVNWFDVIIVKFWLNQLFSPNQCDVIIRCDAIYADDTTLYSKCDQASDLWQQVELASELESDLRDTVH